MSNFFYKFNILINSSKSNSFKFLPFLIFLAFTLVEVHSASKISGESESIGGGGDKDEAPGERVHGNKSKITFSRKRPPTGEYVVGVIRGIPVGGVTR